MSSPHLHLETFIQNVISSSSISSLSLSPSGTQVLYSRTQNYTAHDDTFPKSALWISDLLPSSKARQLTSGDHADTSPAWGAEEKEVYFLSNRHKQDDKPGPAAIYALPLKAGGEAYALTSTERKKAVSAFFVSPDGGYIAYLAPREPTAEEEKKEKEKDDPLIFGDRKSNAQVHLLSLRTRQTCRLELGARDTWHVITLSWSPDSKSLAVKCKVHSSLEFNESPVAVLKLSIAPNAQGGVEEVCVLPRLKAPLLFWPWREELAMVQSYDPAEVSSSTTIYLHPASSDEAQKKGERAWQRFYGDVEDITGLADVQDGQALAAMVAQGVRARLDIVTSSGERKVLWESDGWAPKGAYDVKRTQAGDYVLAVVVSSGSRSEPAELWTGAISSSAFASGETLKLTEKLTSHNAWASDLPKINLEIITYPASSDSDSDGMQLEGLVICLKDKERSKLPTVLFPHGGPYHRDSPDFDVEFFWSWLGMVLGGYLVLCPQYSGSSGYGHAFAQRAKGQMGTRDWTDSYALLQHAISAGWSDPDRLGLAGWSQGGFLTAWGVGQTKDVFKAGVMGAGVADWGVMAAESDLPEFEADLGGSWPWSEERVDQKGSPIRHVKGIRTPLLILHGEKDARVPATQGIMFHRALRRASGWGENHELVIYPREPHGFKEKKHAEDVMRRLVGHMDAYLK